jgi:hypothetical protein
MCIGVSTNYAQFNPSFEQYDSLSRLTGWKLVSGNITGNTLKLINNIPFTATQGNFYIELSHDTINDKKGSIANRFALNDTPSALYIDAFCVPAFVGDFATIKLLLTTSANDTVLLMTDSIKPITAPGNPTQILLRWNVYGYDLKPFYRSNQIPDSAYILITNSTSDAGSAILFTDNIRFSDFALGSTKASATSKISIFPNPCNGPLYITGMNKPGRVNIYSLQGEFLHSIDVEDFSQLIDFSDLSDGLYLLHIRSDSVNGWQKILIRK